MRVMVMIKATKEPEVVVPPSAEAMARMNEFNDELLRAGVLLAGDGLKPTRHGKLVRFSRGKKTVLDGPFTESKEFIAGYEIWEVKSMDEAMEWIRRFPDPSPGSDSEIEVRPWRVVRSGGTITGQWQVTAASPAQPVELHLMSSTPATGLEPGEPGPAANNVTYEGERTDGTPELMPYNLERARTPVTLGPEQTLGAGAYRMATDPRTHVYWPRLTRLPDAAAMARLNTMFEQNRALAIAEAQDCADMLMESPRTGEGRHSRPVADIATIRVTHLGVHLVSLTLAGSIDCGGAHPSNFFANVTYDANGRLYDPAQLLRLDTAARRAAFARAWQPLMRARMASHRGSVIRECLTATGDDGLLPVTYRLSEHGLVVTEYNDSGAGAACNQDLAELTLAQLAPFLAPGAATMFN